MMTALEALTTEGVIESSVVKCCLLCSLGSANQRLALMRDEQSALAVW